MLRKSYKGIIIICSFLAILYLSYIALAADSNTQSIEFAPSAEQCSEPDTASTSVTGNLTIEAWVKMYSDPASGAVYGIAGKHNLPAGRGSYSFDYNNNSGTLQLQLRISSDGSAATTVAVNKQLAANRWYYVAVAYNAAGGSADFYLKEEGGNLEKIGDTKTGLPTSIFDSIADFQIGGTDDAAKFDGIVDEVKLWSRLRTKDEIENASDNEIGTAIGGLQGYWKFTGNGNDATANANNLSCSAGARFFNAIPDRSRGSSDIGNIF